MDRSMLKLNTTGSDYTEKSMGEFYEKNSLNNRIISQIQSLRQSGRRSILIFVPSIEKANEIEEQVEEARAVHSKMKTKDRSELIEGFKSLDIPVLVNVSIARIGFDHPFLDGLIMARPTNSFEVYYQALGRIVRPQQGKRNGKIVDLSGNVNHFGKLEEITFEQEEGRWGMFVGDYKMTLGTVYKGKGLNKIWFGKHAGKHLSEVPKGYLKWMSSDEFTPFNEDVKELKEKAKEYV